MEASPDRILFEDNHLLIYNKSPGELVQGDKTGDEPLVDSLKRFIKTRDSKPGNVFLGVTHRLDRPTSGAVVFAKTSKALSRMNKILADGAIEKRYWAVVDSMPPEPSGTLVHYCQRDPKRNKSTAHTSPGANRKRAELRYRLLKSSDRYHLVEVELITGRHHQIRAQFAAVGCRIRGDLKYGFARSNKDGGIHLHARSLAFDHPVNGPRVDLRADPPREPLWDYFASSLDADDPST